MQQITGKTKLLGVIGDPVGHSLSPVMHNAALRHLGLDYVYLPFPVKRGELERAIAGFEAIGVLGFSITIPQKQAIIPFLAEISPVARTIGAVNTVWRTKSGWHGTNTDVEGFLAPLKKLGLDWQPITPVILGNGGAARAVVAGCAELGCPKIHVVGRNQTKLEQFERSWEDSSVGEVLSVHSWNELDGLIANAKLLVNTTPVGMSPQVKDSPVDDKTLDKLPSGAIAYDLIYTPNPTQFLKQAYRQGATIIDGLEMLVQQGASAFKIWLDRPAPVEIMSRSLRQYLHLGSG